MMKLEERLGITTIPPSTTTEPTTEPYTGPSTRKTLAPHFDPDYIFDPNWPMKDVKRLKRCVSDTNRVNHVEKVSFYNAQPQSLKVQNVGAMSNALKIFPSGDLTQVQPLCKDSKLWIKSKREEFGLDVLSIGKQNILKTEETKLKRSRRELNNLKSGNIYLRKKKQFPNEDHVILRRDLGKIVRRSTKRPHLSRKFKSQSRKRYKQDSRMAQMITNMQANITIIPEFLNMKQVLDDCAQYNLSTLFYVYNNVAYFGSLPADLITTKPTVLFTKAKPMTYELGATQVLGANIFNDENKRQHKVSPADIDIPSIDLEHQATTEEPESHRMKDVSETEINETTKLKRKRKKKSGDGTESSSNTSKKTRAKRKSTKAVHSIDSLENSLEQDTSSSKVKAKKRKVRSLGVKSEDALCVVEVLPTFLCLIHNNMHLRRKRNANKEDETKNMENLEENSKLGHFGKLKESFKRSKNNVFTYVREKKESLVDMPRRARYIAREMYLDGKFFFQELKEVPDRMRKDYRDKKDFLKLVWDMLKIFMPVTEFGEKGGTTPETKVVEDPKQYVKNPADYITPDLSDLNGPPETSVKRKTFKGAEPKTERTTETARTSVTKTTPKETEKKTAPVKSERQFKEITKKTAFEEVSTVLTTTEDPSTKSTPIRHNGPIIIADEPRTLKTYHNEPLLITDERSTMQTYHTRVVGPDYVRDDENVETTTLKFNKFDRIIEKVQDEETFDRLSETMKNKNFMNDILKNADTNRLRSVMGDIKPQDVLKKLDEKTIHKMGKLMTELDTDTIRQMQELVMKTTNFGSPGNKVVKTR